MSRAVATYFTITAWPSGPPIDTLRCCLSSAPSVGRLGQPKQTPGCSLPKASKASLLRSELHLCSKITLPTAPSSLMAPLDSWTARPGCPTLVLGILPTPRRLVARTIGCRLIVPVAAVATEAGSMRAAEEGTSTETCYPEEVATVLLKVEVEA